MNHLLYKIKESRNAKICILVGFCISVALIYIANSSGNDSQQVSEESPKLVRTMPFMQKVGGLGELVEKDDEVTAVVDKIKPALEEKTGLKFESLEVIHYKSQVVAGTNYFVKAKAKPVGGDEQIVHLRIYQDLKRELELTAYQMGKLLGDEVTYFQ